MQGGRKENKEKREVWLDNNRYWGYFDGFGYTFYDGGLRYSGLMLMIMGIVSIAFGFIMVGYSTQIKRKYME